MDRAFRGIWIPRKIWLATGLSATEKVLLAEIDSLYSDEHGGCYASNDYLCEFLGVKTRRLQYIIAKLRKEGYLEEVEFDGRQRVFKAVIPDSKKTSKNCNKVHGSHAQKRTPHLYREKSTEKRIEKTNKKRSQEEPEPNPDPLPQPEPSQKPVSRVEIESKAQPTPELDAEHSEPESEGVKSDACDENTKPHRETPKGRKISKYRRMKKIPSKDLELEHSIAIQLTDAMRECKSDYLAPSNLTPWAKQIDLMMRIDNRSREGILALFRWAINDDFWCDKFFKPNPPKYLRGRFDQLEMKMKSSKKERKFAPCSDDDEAYKAMMSMNETAL